MVHVRMNEISQKIEEVIHQVEQGENCLIFKEGTPIAEIHPIKTKGQGWKRKVEKIKLPEGVTAQYYIELERNLQ